MRGTFPTHDTVYSDFANERMYAYTDLKDVNGDSIPDITVMGAGGAYPGYIKTARAIVVSSGAHNWVPMTGTFPVGFYEDLNNDGVQDYITPAGNLGYLSNSQALNGTGQLSTTISNNYNFWDVNNDGLNDVVATE